MADCKRKTANLFDKDNSSMRYYGYINNVTNKVVPSASDSLSIIVPVEPNSNYTISKLATTRFRVGLFTNYPVDGSIATAIYGDRDGDGLDYGTTLSFFTSTNTSYIMAFIRNYDDTVTVEEIIQSVMVNEGSTPLPYEPYGWVHSLRKYGTDTDILASLPVNIYADGNTATVGLKGNTAQSDTPTPDNPIMPQGCGERTGNLFDYRKIVPGYTYDSNGQMILNPDTANRWRYAAVPLIEVEPSATYLRTYNLAPLGNSINFYDSNKNFLERATPGTGIPVTVPSNCNFVSFVIQVEDMDAEKYMFTKGSTPPETYEPYGIKIPILSANTTTTVYLGEVQTTRRIRKLVLDGTENWNGYDGTVSGVGVTLLLSDMLTNSRMNGYCTHFTPQSSPVNSAIDGITYGASNTSLYITFSVETATALNLTDATSVKTWIAAQYAAGAPVTVWYVLASETTGTVNEPLMKIGDYADTVSSITVPTITGKDSFDVETTLKPSEVSLSYTGWHDATVGEWDGSQWNQ